MAYFQVHSCSQDVKTSKHSRASCSIPPAFSAQCRVGTTVGLRQTTVSTVTSVGRSRLVERIYRLDSDHDQGDRRKACHHVGHVTERIVQNSPARPAFADKCSACILSAIRGITANARQWVCGQDQHCSSTLPCHTHK